MIRLEKGTDRNPDAGGVNVRVPQSRNTRSGSCGMHVLDPKSGRLVEVVEGEVEL